MARPKVMIPLSCTWCGKSFERIRCDHMKNVRAGRVDHYCSRTCVKEHFAIKTNSGCQTCGALVKRGRKFCSKKCQPSQKRLERKLCGQCGISFQPAHSGRRFCSVRCKNVAHRYSMRGALNSNFGTGADQAFLLRPMKALILERDQKCVICAATTGLLIHHVRPSHADNRSVNLVTLCRGCHVRHHKSHTTPFPRLHEIARARSRSMTSKWRNKVASLLRGS